MLRTLSWSRLLVAASTFAALACDSGAQPSQGAGEKILRSRIDSGNGDRIELVSFRKIDGQTGQMLGVPLYEMQFEGEAQFRKDARLNYLPGGLVFSAIRSRPYTDSVTRSGFLSPPGTVVMDWPARRGDRLLLKGYILFGKKESGWHPNEVKFEVTHDSTKRGGAAPKVSAKQTNDTLVIGLGAIGKWRHETENLCLQLDGNGWGQGAMLMIIQCNTTNVRAYTRVVYRNRVFADSEGVVTARMERDTSRVIVRIYRDIKNDSGTVTLPAKIFVFGRLTQ